MMRKLIGAGGSILFLTIISIIFNVVNGVVILHGIGFIALIIMPMVYSIGIAYSLLIDKITIQLKIKIPRIRPILLLFLGILTPQLVYFCVIGTFSWDKDAITFTCIGALLALSFFICEKFLYKKLLGIILATSPAFVILLAVFSKGV